MAAEARDPLHDRGAVDAPVDDRHALAADQYLNSTTLDQLPGRVHAACWTSVAARSAAAIQSSVRASPTPPCRRTRLAMSATREDQLARSGALEGRSREAAAGRAERTVGLDVDPEGAACEPGSRARLPGRPRTCVIRARSDDARMVPTRCLELPPCRRLVRVGWRAVLDRRRNAA